MSTEISKEKSWNYISNQQFQNFMLLIWNALKNTVRLKCLSIHNNCNHQRLFAEILRKNPLTRNLAGISVSSTIQKMYFVVLIDQTIIHLHCLLALNHRFVWAACTNRRFVIKQWPKVIHEMLIGNYRLRLVFSNFHYYFSLGFGITRNPTIFIRMRLHQYHCAYSLSIVMELQRFWEEKRNHTKNYE